MGLLQRATEDTRRKGGLPVGHPRLHAGDADDCGGLSVTSRRSAFAAVLLNLPGGGFAFVMATGIVSLAAVRLGYDKVAAPLFAVNLVAFPVLCALLFVRLVRHPAAILGELRRHRTAAGFLTAVAAISILGDQFALLGSNDQAAAALWICSLIRWFGLVYAFFAALTIAPVKPPLALGLDGSWLLAVVATQAPAILATHVSRVVPRPGIAVFVGLCLFLLGSVLYLILISLIVQRWLFEPMRPEQFTLPYWINMGAAAITALAGTGLLSTAGANPLTAALAQLIGAAIVLFWAIATWWIPLLVMLLIWRHIVHGVPLSFQSEYWSMVFPLGMYTAATLALSRQNGAEFLAVIPRVCIWVASAAWLFGLVGMILQLSHRVRRG